VASNRAMNRLRMPLEMPVYIFIYLLLSHWPQGGILADLWQAR